MRRLCLLLALPMLMCAWSVSARAGSYADALSQCLIRSTTPADQKTVVRWAFATMALDPDVAPMATISSAQRAAINQKAGALVTDLLAKSCSQPAQQALRANRVRGLGALGDHQPRHRTARDAGRRSAAAIHRYRQVDVADSAAGVSAGE